MGEQNLKRTIIIDIKRRGFENCFMVHKMGDRVKKKDRKKSIPIRKQN